MKNHFIFPYAGNKREEVDTIVKTMDMKDIHTIVEPFCGTSALSYYISTLYPLKYMYHLNDINKELIDLYMVLKDKERCAELETEINNILSSDTFNKEEYNKVIKSGTLAGFFIRNKVYTLRAGLFPLDYKYKKITFDAYPIVSFLRTENVVLSNRNAIDIINEYDHNKRVIIYLDPPYIQTCNDFYMGASGVKFNVYEHMYMKNYKKSNIYVSLEDIWITNLICQKYEVLDTYAKTYSNTHKKTRHRLYRLCKKRRVTRVIPNPEI